MTTISIEITASEPARTPTRRHVQIPPNDQKTQDWFEIQKDPSASVRRLIADEIFQHGMVDRITRQKFGAPLAQAAARAAQGPVASVAAAAATPTGSAFTAPTPSATTPTPWSVPLLDQRDVQIADLQSQLAARDAELAQLRQAVGPFSAFIEEIHREGLKTNVVV